MILTIYLIGEVCIGPQAYIYYEESWDKMCQNMILGNVIHKRNNCINIKVTIAQINVGH